MEQGSRFVCWKCMGKVEEGWGVILLCLRDVLVLHYYIWYKGSGENGLQSCREEIDKILLLILHFLILSLD